MALILCLIPFFDSSYLSNVSPPASNMKGEGGVSFLNFWSLRSRQHQNLAGQYRYSTQMKAIIPECKVVIPEQKVASPLSHFIPLRNDDLLDHLARRVLRKMIEETTRRPELLNSADFRLFSQFFLYN